MSEKEPKSSRPKTKIIEDLPEDNFYVAALKNAMNERSISLDEALAIWRQDATKDPSGFHHLEAIEKAAAAIRSQLEKKKS